MRLRSVAQIQRFLQCFEIPIRLTKRGLVVVSSRIGSANCWLPEKPFRPADTWRSQSEYEPTNEDATHALADSFPLLIFLGFISPLIALVSALVFYAHHRERVEPERRVPVIAFILVLIACGVGAGLFGLYLGLELACKRPNPGNLCELWAFLVTGPILIAFGIFLVGLIIYSIPRPAA
jgi:hypothetical protein